MQSVCFNFKASGVYRIHFNHDVGASVDWFAGFDKAMSTAGVT
jgi:hypothetical protein